MKKEQVWEFVKKWYKDAAALVFITLAVTVLVVHFLGLRGQDLTYPLEYKGGDEMSALVSVRLVQESGWNIGTDKLTALDGYYYNTSDVIAGLHNADVFFEKLFLWITGGQVAKTVNLVYLSAFYMIAYVAYFVLRQLRIKEWLSIGGALVYAFLPFIFIRGIGHIVLSCYYFVPLAVLMCIWLYEDERFMLPGKGFFKYKRNYAGFIMAFLIASEGIGYWQIFACFFLMVAMLTALLRTKDWNYLKRGCISILSVIVCVVISIIPEIFYRIVHGGTGLEGRIRSIADSETYCLKIIQLLLPVNGHGIRPLEKLIYAYNEYVPCVNENWTAYIGIVGAVGFLFLLVWLFTRRKNESTLTKRLTVLADLNICGILLATMGGFGSIIFMMGIEIIRGYNRISVFIGFFAITAVCLLLNEWEGKIAKTVWKCVYMGGVALVMLFAIWEQNPSVSFNFESNKEEWISDADFFARVDAVMDEDDSIFQLPYAEYPEGDIQNDMGHLSHYIGYLHSDKLKWSFGTTDGSDTDIWYEQTASLPVDKMIQEILSKGFDGLYINRDAYEEPEWTALEKSVQEYTGVTPVVSNDERLVFYKLR